MATLKENMDAIKAVKDTVIKSENIKKGIKIFDVEGSFEGASAGDVKLFESVNAMNADTSAEESQKALVWETKILPITVGMSIKELILNPKVVLDSAITTSISYYNSAYTIRFMLSSTMFRIMISGASDTSIRYTSTDGLTYVLDEGEPTTIVLAENSILDDPYNEYNDIFSYFMSAKTELLEGIYEYNEQKDNSWIMPITNITLNSSANSITSINTEEYLPTLVPTLKKLIKYFSDNSLDTNADFLVVRKGNEYYAHSCYLGSSFGVAKAGYYGVCSASTPNSYTATCYKYKLDLENGDFEEIGTQPLPTIFTSVNNYKYYGLLYNMSEYDFILMWSEHNGHSNRGYTSIYDITTTGTSKTLTSTDFIGGIQPSLKYHKLSGGTTVETSNQLLPGVSGYGPLGIITGDESIYENLDYEKVVNTFCPNNTKLYRGYSSDTSTIIDKALCLYMTDTDKDYTRAITTIDPLGLQQFIESQGHKYNDSKAIARKENEIMFIVTVDEHDNTIKGTKLATVKYNIITKTFTLLDITAEKYATDARSTQYSYGTAGMIGLLHSTMKDDNILCFRIQYDALIYNVSFSTGKITINESAMSYYNTNLVKSYFAIQGCYHYNNSDTCFLLGQGKVFSYTFSTNSFNWNCLSFEANCDASGYVYNSTYAEFNNAIYTTAAFTDDTSTAINVRDVHIFKFTETTASIVKTLYSKFNGSVPPYFTCAYNNTLYIGIEETPSSASSANCKIYSSSNGTTFTDISSQFTIDKNAMFQAYEFKPCQIDIDNIHINFATKTVVDLKNKIVAKFTSDSLAIVTSYNLDLALDKNKIVYYHNNGIYNFYFHKELSEVAKTNLDDVVFRLTRKDAAYNTPYVTITNMREVDKTLLEDPSPITGTEYNTAVSTADIILGQEVTE